MNSTILKLNEIEIGSVWSAADGGAYGVKVIGKNEVTDDVIVVPITATTEGAPYHLDTFKLQYRYFLIG